MNKRKLESIVNNSRRDTLMQKYVEEHGGEFVKTRGGWTYVEEQVVHNKVEKVEKRKEKRKKEVESKLFRKTRSNRRI